MTRGVLLTAVTGCLLGLTAAAGQSQAPDKDAKPRADLRKIPLVVQRVFLPDFAKEETPKDKVIARLDSVTEYEPDADVTAAVTGAKLAGWAAGYEFTPVQALKKGEKPRDVIDKLSKDSDLVLLVRVSTRTANLGDVSIISVFADAALHRKPKLELITNGGLIAAEKIDPKQIKDDKVQGEYWLKMVSSAFARGFDEKVLGKVQNSLDSKEIADAIGRLRKASKPDSLKPSVKDLEGGAERAPQLTITGKKAGVEYTVYLDPKEKNSPRKWLVGGAMQVDTELKPGQYTLYMETPSEKPHESRVYRDEVRIEFKKRYSYVIP